MDSMLLILIGIVVLYPDLFLATLLLAFLITVLGIQLLALMSVAHGNSRANQRRPTRSRNNSPA